MNNSSKIPQKDILTISSQIQSLDLMYENYAKKNGLTYISLYVLEVIYYNPVGCTQRLICDTTLYPKQTVNMVVRSFIQKGYVALEQNDVDRRNKVITLTDVGIRFAKMIFEPYFEAANSALSSLEKGERTVMLRTFGKFTELIRKNVEEALKSRQGAPNVEKMLDLYRVTKDSKDLERIKRLYEKAFPKKERRNFRDLLRVDESMEMVALYDGDIFCGFACMLCGRSIIHIIYLAIEDELRGGGYGSRALRAIHEYKSGMRFIVDIELEDENAENNEQRRRRKQFYLRNGYMQTEISYRWRHEDYEILSYGGDVSEEEYEAFWGEI